MSTHHELSPLGPIVIVVDGDPAVRNSLRFSLEVEGFAVHDYASGVELLRDTGRSSGGCLVVDQNAPGMTGLDLVARLRERAITFPTILMAGRVTPALKERANRDGISFVEKPLLDDVLFERIRDAFSRATIAGE